MRERESERKLNIKKRNIIIFHNICEEKVEERENVSQIVRCLLISIAYTIGS